MDTAWIQVFVLTLSECVAPAGKTVCHEHEFELQFLTRADCEVALQQLVSLIPAGRLLLETDAPYLLPRDLVPKPSSRVNEPANLPHILRAVARHRGESETALAQQVFENTKLFFNIT